MTKRALLYARTSGDDRKRDSLPDQLKMCRNHALERGWLVVDEFAEDVRGVSGADFDAPRLNEALDLAQSGRFDILVVRELDRFARSLAKQLVIEGEFRRAGVDVEYVLESYDDTPEGKLQKHVKAVVAEYERLKIAQRMVRGRRRKVKNGNVLAHSRPPYGYRVEMVSGKWALVIYEPEARIVRLIFTWYTEGDGDNGPMSIKAIARQLTGMQIPTRTRQSKKWREGTIHGILANETYAGTWRYGKTRRSEKGKQIRNPDEHLIAVDVTPIIERQTWEEVQERFAYNGKHARRNRRHEYLLSGRITCGLCGYAVQGESKMVGGKLYVYYRCPVTRNPNKYDCECSLPYFRADHVESAVWDTIKEYLGDSQKIRQGYEERQAELERANIPLRERLVVVDELLTENQSQLERALDLYLSGDFPKEMLTERKTRLEKIIDDLDKERTSLVARLEAQTLTDEQIESFERFLSKVRQSLDLADTDFETRRHVIEMIGAEITLTIEEGEKVVWLRCIVGGERGRLHLRPQVAGGLIAQYRIALLAVRITLGRAK